MRKVDKLIEGAAGVGLAGDKMVFVFGAGFEEHVTLVGFVVGAGKLVGGRVFCGIGTGHILRELFCRTRQFFQGSRPTPFSKQLV